MKKILSITLSLVILLSSSFVIAAEDNQSKLSSDQMAVLYSRDIDSRIVTAKRDASWRSKASGGSDCSAGVSERRAEFYAKNKDELIKDMLTHKEIGTNGYKMTYFLVTSFNSANVGLVSTCRLEKLSGHK